MIFNLIKKIPWWGWAVLAIAILFFWQSLSGWAYSKKLYDMALDNLRSDQSKVIKVLEENQTMYEQEIQKLEVELESIKSQQEIVKAENERLKGKVSELQSRRENIIISSDPDILVNDLHRLGIGSAIRINRRSNR